MCLYYSGQHSDGYGKQHGAHNGHYGSNKHGQHGNHYNKKSYVHHEVSSIYNDGFLAFHYCCSIIYLCVR